MSATLAILVLASGVLAVHLATVLLALRRLRPHQGTAGVIGTPRVTLLRPVCGLDPFDAETLTSSFRQDYPGFEVIFCAQRPDDPVIALIERLIAAHPQVPARLMIGDDPVSRNPKLNNVWKGWHAARHDWICMTDSNLLLPPDYLATVVSAWREGTGLVSSPAVGIRPQGWGGHLECAVLNGNQARWQLAADSLGDGFAQGKTLFFNRPLLERAGGLRALGRLIAEDAAATHVVRGLGLKVRLTPMPFAQPVGRRSLRQVWDRQLRWSRVRRDGFPGLFALEGLNSALPLALVLAGLGNLGVALAFLALWYAAEWHLTRRAGWPATWRDALALPLRDAMLPALWLATWRRRGFTWRGTPMDEAPARP
ncbi:MAG: glycosyltransferase [Rhodobacter sp.]|uniref:ceramide glucosyltransferase n=1 Tax=Pararhodobacter sp. TaxID=2127056 RepID=UPI002BD21563|nr:ceramide glucosyltransferase [Pararhodobacter sp.]MCC0072718.1 glycosyltransferase [Rhodobacter sp.]HPD90963.1 ceramide glucosyltransferase [Pararhodobacter sp.]